MSLRVRFWGTRGSVPTPGPGTVRYGGNTPCVEVRTDDGWLIILDAGTGIRELGRALLERSNGAPIQGDIFLTHAHWDHIQGIPFFAPIFGRGNHFTIWGSQSLEKSVDQVVRDQMSPVVFPVTFEELDATIDFRELSEGTRSEGTGYDVTAFAVQHPGGALGYRFTESGARSGALVYVSDNELGTHPRYGSSQDWRERMVEFVRGARVLVHDTTYTVDEYDHHRGWGHSTFSDAVELALEAGVEKLVLFHHEPRRTDDQLDVCLAECRAMVKARGVEHHLQVIAAAEGLSLTL
ncbi:MAG TPA: MBL fold metallo-hydrolase [Gemmatimonadaceae bacterium]|nr:MBL fold metallo-hydrolase [Gemmatimonadaceae bacterium]